ncbi:MAG: hypothetical protein AB1416_09745, partial [Actinomycetota bacterium]
AVGAGALVVAAALGQLEFLLAATVLIFFDADLVLAGALAPGAVAGIASVTLGSGDRAIALGTAGVVASVTLAVLAAFREVRSGEASTAESRPSPGDLASSVLFLGYGFLAGGLVAMPALAVVSDPDRAGAFVAAAMLPLALSMGVAELQLRRYRIATQRLLASERDLDAFGRASWARLLRAAGLHGTSLVALTAGAAGVAWIGGWLSTAVVAILVGEVVLGVALFLALVLIACGQVRVVVSVLGGVAAVVLAARLAGAAPEQAPGFLTTCVLAFACLTAVAFIELRKAVNHR